MGHTLVLTEAPEFELIPAGTTLMCEVVEVKHQDSIFWVDKDDQSQGKQKEFSFKFNVTEDGPYLGRFIYGRTSTAFTTHSNCRLRQWVEEIFSFDDLPVDFTYDTDTMIGQPVKVVVGVNEWTDKKTNELRQRNYADTLLRADAYEPF